jgi:hypothetical protein
MYDAETSVNAGPIVPLGTPLIQWKLSPDITMSEPSVLLPSVQPKSITVTLPTNLTGPGDDAPLHEEDSHAHVDIDDEHTPSLDDEDDPVLQVDDERHQPQAKFEVQLLHELKELQVLTMAGEGEGDVLVQEEDAHIHVEADNKHDPSLDDEDNPVLQVAVLEHQPHPEVEAQLLHEVNELHMEPSLPDCIARMLFA